MTVDHIAGDALDAVPGFGQGQDGRPEVLTKATPTKAIGVANLFGRVISKARRPVSRKLTPSPIWCDAAV
jgi:hypothetical protein